MIPWSASSGATRNTPQIATTERTAATSAQSADPFPRRRTARSVIEHRLESRVRHEPEQYRIPHEEQTVVAVLNQVVRASGNRVGRAGGGDHERDEQRQEQHREQELAGAREQRQRGDEGAEDADADIGDQAGEEEPADVAPERAVDEEHAEQRHDQDLHRDQVADDRDRLGDEQHHARHRGHQQALQHALLPLRDVAAADPEHRGERERHPEEPAGELGEVALARAEAELEQHHRQHGEEDHRDHGVAGAQLQAQVLEDEGPQLPEGARLHATSASYVTLNSAGSSPAVSTDSTTLPRRMTITRSATATARSTSWVTSTAARVPRTSPRRRSSSAAPCASRPLCGSSSSRTTGRWSISRARPSRWAMPWLKARTGSKARESRPTSSSTSSMRPLGSRTP